MKEYTREAVASHLMEAEGNYVRAENGRTVEHVNMCGGKFLRFDEEGEVVGFANLNVCLDFLGL